jgi:AcrR family transcriptional regulator
LPRNRDDRRRRDVLQAVIETMAETGIGSRSLRDIAAAAGTSHRMLLHHFGSRDELLVAVVEEVERQQRDRLAALPDSPLDAARAMWAELRTPSLRPLERLFFECYARAAQGEHPFARLLPGAVDSWLAAVAERAPSSVDAPLARLGLAVTRGLLLDLVATGDETEVDAAYERFLALLAILGGSNDDGPEIRSPDPS